LLTWIQVPIAADELVGGGAFQPRPVELDAARAELVLNGNRRDGRVSRALHRIAEEVAGRRTLRPSAGRIGRNDPFGRLGAKEPCRRADQASFFKAELIRQVGHVARGLEFVFDAVAFQVVGVGCVLGSRWKSEQNASGCRSKPERGTFRRCFH